MHAGQGESGCAGTGAAARTGHSSTLLPRPLREGSEGTGARASALDLNPSKAEEELEP